MQLNELFEPSVRHREVKNHDIDSIKNDSMKSNKGEIGYGMYGKAVPNKKSPFTVKKNNFFPLKNIDNNDGYMYYIRSIVSNKMAQSNPFFPRVYDIIYLIDKDGKQRYRAEIEKLEHSHAFSVEELTQMLKTLYPKRLIGTYNDVYQLTHRLCYLIRQHINKRNAYAPKNEKFKECLDFIIELQNKNNEFVGYDFHDNNIMYRRTGFGPQLVITDPFFNRKRD